MVVRALIYAKMPVANYADWFIRDIVMTLPRIAAFLVSLRLLRGIQGEFWLKIKSPSAVGILLGILTYDLFRVSAFPWVLSFRDSLAIIGWCTTLAVACFEETCFRGLLFQSLMERMTPFKAALLGTLIFTVFHIQAQPITAWPMIFLVGFSLCAAYYRGAGLIWLILVHELIDGLDMHVNWDDLLYPDRYIFAYVILALTAACSVILLRKPYISSAAEPSTSG